MQLHFIDAKCKFHAVAVAENTLTLNWEPTKMWSEDCGVCGLFSFYDFDAKILIHLCFWTKSIKLESTISTTILRTDSGNQSTISKIRRYAE